VVIDPTWADAEVQRRTITTRPVVSAAARALIDAVGAAGEVLRLLEIRVPELIAYQDEAYAREYVELVRRVARAEADALPGSSRLTEAVARYLFKLMAYKDEYEVARLYTSPHFKAQLDAQFSGYAALEVHLAPPLLSRTDKATGEPRKMRFGPWMLTAFGWLAKGKSLRGGRFDVFGMTAERRLERQMIAEYEGVLAEVADRLTPANHATGVALAALALDIKGFGHIKHRNYEAAKVRERQLLAALRDPGPAPLREAAE
jgi:indolepyruvate ferredoxin oxidoreductase